MTMKGIRSTIPNTASCPVGDKNEAMYDNRQIYLYFIYIHDTA